MKTSQEFLTETNLNWTVSAQELQTSSGIILEKQVAVVRDDTQKVLSVRGKGYELFQNEQLIELLLKVSEKSGLELHKGGYFGDGEKVYIQLKSSNLRLGNDTIEGFVTGVNSFDGTTSLAFGHSNITISCQNTFFAAFRGLDSKVRHTKNMVYKIDDILRETDSTLLRERDIFDAIVRLSEVPVTEKAKDMVIRTLFDIKPKIASYDEVSTYIKNRLIIYNDDLIGEMKEKNETMWGLFSGMTKYTTHSIKEDNTEAKLFGIFGERERVVFNKLVEMVY